MRRGKKLVSMVLLALLLLRTPPSSALAAPFLDHPRWHEADTQKLTQMYQDGDTFAAMVFGQDCVNSGLRKAMVADWMTAYDFDVYGLDFDQNILPDWIWDSLGEDGFAAYPLFCLVRDGTAVIFSADDSMRSIHRALLEYLGIYDSANMDFSRLNAAVAGRYSTRAATALWRYCADETEIPPEIWEAAQEIVGDRSGDREKVRAIYDWVSENIFYDYGMTGENSSRQASALETYLDRSSNGRGYAELTAMLCHAAGIPCRVVTGYAVGEDRKRLTEEVWRSYERYLEDGDRNALLSRVAPYENHAWNEAYVDGTWMILDTAWGSRNDCYPNGRITGTPTEAYFDPDLREFSKTHLFWEERSGDLAVTAEDGCLLVDGVLEEQDVREARDCFLALYDAGGRMLGSCRAELSGTEFSAALEDEGSGRTVRLFLLDDRSGPIAAPYVGEVD